MDVWKRLVADNKTSKQMRETCCNNETVSGGRVFWIFYCAHWPWNRTKMSLRQCEILHRATWIELSMLVLRVQYLCLHRWPCTTCWRPTLSFAQRRRKRRTAWRKDNETADFCDYLTLFDHILPVVLCFPTCSVYRFLWKRFYSGWGEKKLPKGAFKLHICSAERLMLPRTSSCRILSNTHTLHCCYIIHLTLTCLVARAHENFWRLKKADSQWNHFGSTFQIKTEE